MPALGDSVEVGWSVDFLVVTDVVFEEEAFDILDEVTDEDLTDEGLVLDGPGVDLEVSLLLGVTIEVCVEC